MIIISFVSIFRGIVAKNCHQIWSFTYFFLFYPPLYIFETLLWLPEQQQNSSFISFRSESVNSTWLTTQPGMDTVTWQRTSSRPWTRGFSSVVFTHGDWFTTYFLRKQFHLFVKQNGLSCWSPWVSDQLFEWLRQTYKLLLITFDTGCLCRGNTSVLHFPQVSWCFYIHGILLAPHWKKYSYSSCFLLLILQKHSSKHLTWNQTQVANFFVSFNLHLNTKIFMLTRR